VFKESAAVFEHLLEIVSVRSEDFDVDFVDAMPQHFLEDFLFLGRELKVLHNFPVVAVAASEEFWRAPADDCRRPFSFVQ
jgi:hypothetical protein